jgi:hypothetical protein
MIEGDMLSDEEINEAWEEYCWFYPYCFTKQDGRWRFSEWPQEGEQEI